MHIGAEHNLANSGFLVISNQVCFRPPQALAPIHSASIWNTIRLIQISQRSEKIINNKKSFRYTVPIYINGAYENSYLIWTTHQGSSIPAKLFR